jgi:hypothetical protein
MARNGWGGDGGCNVSEDPFAPKGTFHFGPDWLNAILNRSLPLHRASHSGGTGGSHQSDEAETIFVFQEVS